MLYVTEVTSDEELKQINALNWQNLKPNLSRPEQEQHGFVTWLYPVSLLQQLHTISPSVIVKEEDKVVGYALVAPLEAGKLHPDLQTMMDHLQNIKYGSSPLSSYSYYIMGQVCIDRDYRRQGIFNMMFQKHKELYCKKYELLVTEISISNYPSQKAHKKVGFETIHHYKDALDEWNVVVWDWK